MEIPESLDTKGFLILQNNQSVIFGKDKTNILLEFNYLNFQLQFPH